MTMHVILNLLILINFLNWAWKVLWKLPVSPHGEFAPTEFACTSTQLAIKYLKFNFLLPRKNDGVTAEYPATLHQNDNIVRTMKPHKTCLFLVP